MTETILYAGYGTNRDPVMIEAITGQVAKHIGSMHILDHGLWVQRMDQTPTVPVEVGSPTVRDILVANWGPNGEAHGIRREVGKAVVGGLFEVSLEGLDLIANWELVPSWKRRQLVTVRRRSSGEEMAAMTEILPDDQLTVRQIDGLVYRTYLRQPGALHRAAESARLDYLVRRSPD